MPAPSSSGGAQANATAQGVAASTADAPRYTTSVAHTVSRIMGHRRASLIAAVLALGVLAGASFALYKFVGRSRPERGVPVAPLQNMKFTRIPVSGDVFESVISPDGRFIARVVYEKGKSSLRLRQVSGTTERDVVPPAEVYFMEGTAFSPDGNSLYYVVGEQGKSFRRLYRVALLGGDPQKLIDDVDTGVALSPDGKRLAFYRGGPKTHEGMLVVANEDGTGEQVMLKRMSPAEMRQPAWSPDGQTLAYPALNKDDEGQYDIVEAMTLSDRSTRPVSPARWLELSSLRWLPEGAGLLSTGKPRTALVMQADLASNIRVMPAGDFARARQITNSNSDIGELCWTPDGRIIYSAAPGGSKADLWVTNPDGTGSRQLTFTADRSEFQPSLSPDGRQLIFMTKQAGLFSLWRMNVDGGGAKELVRNISRNAGPQVSPDAQWVFYNALDETGNNAYWKVPFEGSAPVMLRVKVSCLLSPDGKWFGCEYREPVFDALAQLLVIPAAGGDPTRTLASPRGRDSRTHWSPDGQGFDFIATRDGIANVWRLSLASDREQKLTDWQIQEPLYDFAWSRDNKQLAVTRYAQKNEIILIQNFR